MFSFKQDILVTQKHMIEYFTNVENITLIDRF